MIDIKTYNLRDFGIGQRKQVDDTPYGGGAGMVIRVDVVDAAIKNLKSKIENLKSVLLTPQGKKFDQKTAVRLSRVENLLLICGHYEGFDERIRDLVDQEISIGDYILTGGELPAMVIIDAISRLLPGVLGKDESSTEESFNQKLLEYPHYTKPAVYQKKAVPAILTSGHHQAIAQWRQEQSLIRTKTRRPDLMKESP
ncbi:MAG: tRNA (guanine37-N1)-methyltransferase [Candidatus Berkelbacteria bacterium Licking1014_2]|uniref:tRNA (guanine-N(1)-)-methyltransferase n=1 Tax=Candidatus Berkelbacteria bacterium Licking1014_2 TaxID=2017146 RepID=A0A554LUS4_9BACT|nr:MAG: tRNA (guanine37-N1)-methyltransferase [Candidatus Berkelbacteria bacterium Licking1014_2]